MSSRFDPHNRSGKKHPVVNRRLSAWIALCMAGGAFWAPVLAAKSLDDSDDHEALLRAQEARIAERDRLIESLVARIERLERQVVALDARTATPSPLDAAALERVSAGQSGRASPPAATARDTSRTASATPSRPAASGPGQFAVDPEAAERALERTLVQSGALLLPWRKAEIDLSYSYQRTESTSPLLVRLGDDLVLANQRRERNLSTVRADLRIGLPNEWQLEFGLPYSLADEDRLADLGANGRVFDKAEGRGLGDFSIALARTLARERGWRPDLIARLTYDSGSGGDTGALALNDGIEQFSAELVALKRQDPLAFVLSGFYQISGEEHGIAPGDQWGLSASTLLAASPDTSLRFGVSHSVRRALELDGQSIAGSDEVIGLLNIGLSAILAPGIMLNLTAGLGLSDDAPDYYVQLSLPIRFDW